MVYSSFFMKEVNFTKNGKKIGNKTQNCYAQMVASLKHSLRIQTPENTDKNIHIINSKTCENEYFSDLKFENNEELLKKIEEDIQDKILKFENIKDENERKKIFKDFQNSKSSILKKIPLELLELEMEQSKNAGTILHNLVYKYKVKNLKSHDKRTLKSLENYISLKNKTLELKEKTRKYNNQTLLKEVIFKIPENQNLDLKKEEWNIIINNFKNEYYRDYSVYSISIHNDEGKENKSHVHLFLSSYNNNKNDFDINKNCFEYIKNKYNLKIDEKNVEDHKVFMKQFQEDFYIFLNKQLKELGKKERVEHKQYLTKNEIEKRLQIKKDDSLTITQKHVKLANQKITEYIDKMGSKIEILDLKFSENSSFFNSRKTQKIEIEVEKNEDVRSVVKAIKNYSKIGNLVENLEEKNREKDIKIFSLNQKIDEENRFFNKKENELLQKIDDLKNNKNEDKNKLENDLKNEHEENKIFKNILKNITKEEIKNEEINKDLEKNIFEKLEKITKEKIEDYKKLENERLKNKKKEIEEIEVK